jgi:hypothetical protein
MWKSFLVVLICAFWMLSTSQENMRPSKVPDLEIQEAVSVALAEMSRLGLSKKYAIRSARFIAGQVRGWEFILTPRDASTKSEPQLWLSLDRKVELRPGR